MGLLFSGGSKAAQTTTNQQVGVSGGIGFGGVSGSKGATVAQQGTAIAGGIRAYQGSNISIISSDIAALESNQNIAMAAINAAAQTTIGALQSLTAGNANAAQLISEVQAGANEVALRATPVSAGEVATAAAANLKPVLIGGIVIAAALAGLILIKH